jgi:hypothetical protein
MNNIASVPEWMGTAILTALVAVLGYFGKTIAEWTARVLANRRALKARLAELLALIRAGDAAFAVQTGVRDKLKKMIIERDPSFESKAESFDHLFATALPSLTPEERELFDVIRAYTVYTIKPLNDALLAWLSQDAEFKIGPAGKSPRAKLAAFLADLEAHLLLWRAKYNAWIPDHPERALVYLADESRHGTPFPKKGASLVLSVLQSEAVLSPGSGLQPSASSPRGRGQQRE